MSKRNFPKYHHTSSCIFIPNFNFPHVFSALLLHMNQICGQKQFLTDITLCLISIYICISIHLYLSPYHLYIKILRDYCSSWIWKRQRNQRSIDNIHWIVEKVRQFQKNIYFCFTDYAKVFDCVDHNKLWKILQEMGIPGHLTCLLKNPYAG